MGSSPWLLDKNIVLIFIPPFCTQGNYKQPTIDPTYTVQYTQDTSKVQYTHTPNSKLLNAADRSSGVVFLTASCFLT